MYIDIVTHLLPAVDDGARTLEETLKELNRYKHNNITHVIFTPHINHPTIKTDITEIKEKYAELKDTIEKNTVVKTYLASQFYVTPKATEFIPYNEKFVFVEFAIDTLPMYAFDGIFNLQLDGYDVVLLHVERYQWLIENKNVVRRLKEMSVLFEVNFEGLDTKNAKYYLENHLVNFLATNNHLKKDQNEIDLTLFSKYAHITEKAFDILNISNVLP